MKAILDALKNVHPGKLSLAFVAGLFAPILTALSHNQVIDWKTFVATILSGLVSGAALAANGQKESN